MRDVLKYLRYFEPDDIYHEYESIFTDAAIYNRSDMMELLLQSNDDHQDNDGKMLCEYDYGHAMGNAAHHGHIDMVKKLLAIGCQ